IYDLSLTGLEETGESTTVGFAETKGDHEIDHFLSDHVVLPISEHPLGCRAEVADAPILVDGDDPIQGRFKNCPFTRLAFAEGRFDLIVLDGKRRGARDEIDQFPFTARGFPRRSVVAREGC